MRIKEMHCNLYRIPLPVVLSDATHGEMPDFELITVRILTASGLEGVGYTYTVGAGGRAIRALINHEIRPIVLESDARAPVVDQRQLVMRQIQEDVAEVVRAAGNHEIVR